MTSLVAPRYDSPVIYSDTGRMSREWYTFLVTLAKAAGASPTVGDDLAMQLAMNDATGDDAAIAVASGSGAGAASSAVLLWLSM